MQILKIKLAIEMYSDAVTAIKAEQKIKKKNVMDAKRLGFPT